MTDLETRLRSLQTPVADGPTPDELRGRAARRHRHRQLEKVAAGSLTVVFLTAAVAVMWRIQDSPSDQTVIGPDPSTNAPADETPNITIGDVGDARVEVSPRTGLRDGDLVEVRIENLEDLPPDAEIMQCAADETIEDRSAKCDRSSVHKPGSPEGSVSATEHQVVSVSRTINVVNVDPSDADAYDRPYDCATEPAGCALVVAGVVIDPPERPLRAVAVPLTFQDADEPPPTPTASIAPAADLQDHQEVRLTAEGLPPNKAFQVQICAIDSLPDLATDCEGEHKDPMSVESDGNGSLTATIAVQAAIYGFHGRTDCVIEGCTLWMAGPDLMIPLQFAAGVKAPVPKLRIDPPGPYTDRQQVTIYGSGFPVGVNIASDLGICPEEKLTDPGAWCWGFYVSDTWGPDVDVNGEFTVTVQLGTQLGQCLAVPCALGWVVPKGPIIDSTVVPIDFLPEESASG